MGRPVTVSKDKNIIMDLYGRGVKSRLIGEVLDWKKEQIDYVIYNERRKERDRIRFEKRRAENAAPEMEKAISAVAAESPVDSIDDGAIEIPVPASIVAGHQGTFELPVKLRISVGVV